MELTPKFDQFSSEEPLVLENGKILRNYQIQYSTYGELNDDKSNVIWVFHALTANSEVHEWWPGMIGPNKFLDTSKYFILCANMLGSCYGAEEPKDFDFPTITIADIVKSHKVVLERLGISKIKVGIGGSMGGQQLLQWAMEEPDLFENIVPIATNSQHSPWGIAFNEAQRMALRQDDLDKGLEAARAIAMLSYRHYQTFEKSQTDHDDRSDNFSASSYQRYQGEKLRKRFSPYSYYVLSKAMDSHNLGRYASSIKEALSRVSARTFVLGIKTDLLFPVEEQAIVAEHIPNASLEIIDSHFGHDGFLVEAPFINKLLSNHFKTL